MYVVLFPQMKVVTNRLDNWFNQASAPGTLDQMHFGNPSQQAGTPFDAAFGNPQPSRGLHGQRNARLYIQPSPWPVDVSNYDPTAGYPDTVNPNHIVRNLQQHTYPEAGPSYSGNDTARNNAIPAHFEVGAEKDKLKCFCGQTFAGSLKNQKSNLKRHIVNSSTDKASHACPHCPSIYKREDNLKAHIQKRHREASSKRNKTS
jgi:hypothetical protein